MIDDLLPFFTRELGHLHNLAADFAERFPDAARRLQIDRGRCGDPQTERLLESFAWLAARLQLRLDNPWPELAEPLLDLLCPLYSRPVPSAVILQMTPGAEGATGGGGCTLPRHALALAPAVQGVRCRYRTSQAVRLWPLTPARAWLEPSAAGPGQPAAVGGHDLCLELAARPGTTLADLRLDRLSFHLDGPSTLVHLLYDLILSRVEDVWIEPEPPAAAARLPRSRVQPGGFQDEETLFPAEPELPGAWRLLFEFFAFPRKFHFFHVDGLDQVSWAPGASRFNLRFRLARGGLDTARLRLLAGLSANLFKLGCTPAVNLFQESATVALEDGTEVQPIRLPGWDPAAWEVYRVDRVRLRSTGTGHERAQDLPAGRGEGQAPGWVGQRRPSSLPDDPATDLAVRLVDAHLRPCSAASATLELQLTCSNRLLPAAIPFMGGQEDRFQLPRHAVLAGAWPLGRPTPGLPPPAGSGQSWRFLGLLLMNQASLVALDAGALQDLLAIHGFADGAGAARRIRAIRRVTARPVTAVLPEPSQPRCARGLEVELALDEQHLEPGEPFLLALVLEPFLARLCPAGSFIQLRLTDRHDEPLTLRPPVPGEGATL